MLKPSFAIKTKWMLAGVLTTVALGGCAGPKQMAKGATAGAIEEVKEQNQARPNGPPPMQDLASNITKGTMAALDQPETREQLGRVVDFTMRSAVGSAMNAFTRPQWGPKRLGDSMFGFPAGGLGPGAPPGGTPVGPISPAVALSGRMAEGFTLGMSRQLQIELGPNGQGPLGQTMAGVLREATQAAIGGAVHELAPSDCAGVDSKECAERRVRDLSRSAAKGFVDGLGISLQVPLLVAAFLAGVIGSLVVFLLLRLRRPVLIATDAGPIRRMPPNPQTHGA
jgi:hypothetical protein